MPPAVRETIPLPDCKADSLIHPVLLQMSDRPQAIPERFQASPATLRIDRCMTWVIRFGGFGVILAVCGIFVFLFGQVVPLFRAPGVERLETVPFAPPRLHGADAVPPLLGTDEWGGLPFRYEGGATIRFGTPGSDSGVIRLPAGIPVGAEVTAHSYRPDSGTVAVGTRDGRAGTFRIRYELEFQGDRRTIAPSVSPGEFHSVSPAGNPVTMVASGESGEAAVLAAVVDAGSTRDLRGIVLRKKRSLTGGGRFAKVAEHDLTSLLTGEPAMLRVPHTGGAVLVATADGQVDYLFLDGSAPARRQSFRPFAAGESIGSMDFLSGDVSLVLTSATGRMTIWSLLIPEGGSERIFIQTKSFPDLPGPATFFSAGQRNKLFLTGSGSLATLRHATTARVRWEQDVGFPIAGGFLEPRGTGFSLLDDHGNLHRYSLDDPHPEAGWRAWFGRVWYEGATKPDYTWQSSGGTDDFEPKLSLRPLIHGTLKGTLWAMVFAVPLALLAAIYTGQFMRPETKRIVKPVMEIMASLPSVVLGFLAALWLAPLLAPAIPSLLLVAAGVPVLCVAAGLLWSRLPARHRALIPPGTEWLALVPLILCSAWLLWQAGPAVERILFVVRDADGRPLIDPDTGRAVADFRQWWPQATGTPFNQRNTLVVGMMMGFAVIPVIFTIAEDAISSVPPSLTAASAALGASRWQTLRTVVLPVASAGIFSAIMIGLGRAVGETMIVVMATGNTPVMDWNPFSGMRTLAANIATELPEAAVHSTLYRTLFLSALVLFAMTFVINTLAEILRHRLREKYRLI